MSKEFDVSINTLLGDPRTQICQCCGMPLEEDEILGREKDGTLNEEYCKWCYADGTYTYSNMEDLIDVCVKYMVNENLTEEQARAYMMEKLPKLDYWKRYEELSDDGQFEEFKRGLIREIRWNRNLVVKDALAFLLIWILFSAVPMMKMEKIRNAFFIKNDNNRIPCHKKLQIPS